MAEEHVANEKLKFSLTWEKGRQLKSYDSSIYTYNANGIRTSKTKDGVKHFFALDGTKILKETWGSNKLIPIYNGEDSVSGIIYNGTPYYFLKNLQGDIIEITDKNGITKARYSYDAWGVCTITSDTSGVNIATINPFRYRGYYFDTESNLYYLQSRYYDPVVGRFICADDAELCLQDVNLYRYCANSPVNALDPDGRIPLWVCVVGGAVVGAVVGAAIGAIGSKLAYGKVNAWWVVIGAAAGGVLGYIGGAFFGASGIKSGTLASKIKMSRVRRLGRIGEQMANWPKNRSQIPSFTNSAKYRIPDYFSRTEKVIGEVKNVKYLSYTSQLEDYMLFAEYNGYDFILKIRRTTMISDSLKRMVDSGKILISFLK